MMIRTYKKLTIGGESLPDNVELWVEMDGLNNVARFVEITNGSAVDLSSRSSKRYTEVEAVLELLDISFELSIAIDKPKDINAIHVPVFYGISDDNLATVDRKEIIKEVNNQIDFIEKSVNTSRKPFHAVEE